MQHGFLRVNQDMFSPEEYCLLRGLYSASFTLLEEEQTRGIMITAKWEENLAR